jgi:hypothetical protein
MFLFIHNHLTLRKWCYTRLQHNFPLDPMISSFHIHFGTKLCAYVNNNIDIKRILQDKQFHLQLKSEQKEIIQNVLERKDSMAVLPTGFFIHNHLTLRKWCYTRLQHNFPLDPMISSFHIHFGTFVT